MSEYKIEKGVPVPPIVRKGVTHKTKYPWREMEVGDSFFVPRPDGKDVKIMQTCFSGKKRAARFGIRTKTRQWTENGVLGIRVWRIA
jgi:hypothetical protein